MTASSAIEQTVLVPGPAFHVDLAGLDARHPVHYSRRLLIFGCASPAQRDAQVAALKAGLQGLVSRCPILGGKVVPLPGGVADADKDWRTIVPDRGLELIVKDSSSEIASLHEIKAANFPPDLLPVAHLVPEIPPDFDNSVPFVACKVQLNFIDGGSILTFSMSHCVGDGAANNELMRVLSEATRLAHENLITSAENEPPLNAATADMGVDRRALLNLKRNPDFSLDNHPAYRWDSSPPPAIPPLSHPFAASAPEVPTLLRIPAARLTQLKADAQLPGAAPISSHDALAALIWRTTLRIRTRRPAAIAAALPPSTPTQLFLPSDARRHLGISDSYIGNVIYQLTAVLPLGTLLGEEGLREAASALRAAIKAVTPQGAAELLAETNARWPSWGFMDYFASTAAAMGSDWTSGSVFEDEWGAAFGPVLAYRYPGEPATCILPKLPNGDAEVVVSVMKEEVEALRQDFEQYLH